MTRLSPASRHRVHRAFTLIELMTVVAIIGILAAILIPTVGAVRTSANKVKTKAQFSQWATAMELFKQEYGYYPDIATGGKIDAAKFASALTGRDGVGSEANSAAAGNLNGNRKRIVFYTLAEADVSDTGASATLVDPFGNTEIGVMVDTDRDGRITGSAVPVAALSGGTFTPDLGAGVRAGVIFYSGGKGRSDGGAISDHEAVTSWQ